jgi:hypothetical protein
VISTPVFFFLSTALILAIGPLLAHRVGRVLACAAVLFLIFAGNRFNGLDWINYLDIYNAMPGISLANGLLLSPFETLFSTLMWTCASMSLSYGWFVAAIATVNVAALAFVTARSRNIEPTFCLAVLLLIEGWTLYHEQLRQAVAVSLCLVGAWWLVRGHRWRFVGAVLIASGFHITALFALSLAILDYRIKHTKRALSVTEALVLAGVLAAGVWSVLFFADLNGFAIIGLGSIQDKFTAYRQSGIYGASLFNAGLIAYPLGFVALLVAGHRCRETADPWLAFAWSAALLWCVLGPVFRSMAILIRLEHYLLIFLPFAVAVSEIQQLSTYGNYLLRKSFALLFAATFFVRIAISEEYRGWIGSYYNVFLESLSSRPLPRADDRAYNICKYLGVEANVSCAP